MPIRKLYRATENLQEHLVDQGAGVPTTRVEALSDGIFAIAMTLLVLDFKIPSGLSSAQFMTSLYKLGPHVITYVLSFIALGTLWIGHHNQFHLIKRTDRSLLWINILFFMCIAAIPFSTAVMGEYSDQRIAAVVYGGNLIVCTFLLYLNWLHASNQCCLIDTKISQRVITLIKVRTLMLIPLYVLAILLSFLSLKFTIVLLMLNEVLAVFAAKADHVLFDYLFRRRK